MGLPEWHSRLEVHFSDLRLRRSSLVGENHPLFALEHGLTEAERQALSAEVRQSVRENKIPQRYYLPFIAYASEIGYRYSGDEYWHTFEKETPGWIEYGSRYWIRSKFISFAKTYGGAVPTGPWANHFCIICWPITHAILPHDLQYQLAKILYELRYQINDHFLRTPTALGQAISAQAWDASSRFQNFCQETALVGQIASALLFEGDFGTAGLLESATLRRIGEDLNREKQSREWLKSARNIAKARAQLRGFSASREARTHQVPAERVRREVADLGIEPRLILRRSNGVGTAWVVQMEIPDLSHLISRFPEVRSSLASSRCTVTGAKGNPLARGRILYGSQTVDLTRLPRPDEILLQFETPHPQLDYLLRTECLLRPGGTHLFKVATDGLAYEVRGMSVHAGNSYILISTETKLFPGLASSAQIDCDGVCALLLEIPDHIDGSWQALLKRLNVSLSKSIEIWPAGLSAIKWDGDGRGEWLSTERVCLSLSVNHSIPSIHLSLTSGNEVWKLSLGPFTSEDPVYVELPLLPAGSYVLYMESVDEDGQKTRGELEVLVRDPRPWSIGRDTRSPLTFFVDPIKPTLEQLWQNEVEVELNGPSGWRIFCEISLFEDITKPPIVRKKSDSLELPLSTSKWWKFFHAAFVSQKDVQSAYDVARVCTVEFRIEDLGVTRIISEREFSPLRWCVQRSGPKYSLRLIDDSGLENTPTINLYSFEFPLEGKAVPTYNLLNGMQTKPEGGLFVAQSGEYCTSVIIPPEIHGLHDLQCKPVIRSNTCSPDGLIRQLQMVEVWGHARLTGNLLAEDRQRRVIQSLIKNFMALIGGEGWNKIEESFSGHRINLDEVRHAVTKKREEQGIVADLAKSEQKIIESNCKERIDILATMACKHLGLRGVRRIVNSNGSGFSSHDNGSLNPFRPIWLSEFALRLASDPRQLRAWAGADLSAGFKEVMKTPSILRAARCIVLLVHQRSSLTQDLCKIYCGWEWS